MHHKNYDITNLALSLTSERSARIIINYSLIIHLINHLFYFNSLTQHSSIDIFHQEALISKVFDKTIKSVILQFYKERNWI